MKRSEAIALIRDALLSNYTAEQILDLLEHNVGMNPPGDPGYESECGWESEVPEERREVFGPPTPSEHAMKQLLSQLEIQMYIPENHGYLLENPPKPHHNSVITSVALEPGMERPNKD